MGGYKGDLDLKNIYNELISSANNLIKAALPYMEQINNQSGPFVDKLPETDREQYLEKAGIISFEMVGDAESVKNEIGAFFSMILNAEDVSSANNVDLLKSVWLGDEYDKRGIEGLRELIKDMNTQRENFGSRLLQLTKQRVGM